MSSKNESILDHLWKWTSIVAIILVSIMLVSNLIGLLLSFPHVFEDSPDVYVSGIDGSLVLPYLPDDPSSFVLELNSIVGEGEPIDVRLSTISGKVPSMPVLISFETSIEDRRDYILHDQVSETGNWSGITSIPGNLPPGEFNVSLGYRGHTSNIPIGVMANSFEVIVSQDPFIKMDVKNDLFVEENLHVFVEGPSVSDPIKIFYITLDGTEHLLSPGGNGSFILDTAMSDLSGWERISFRIENDDGTDLETDNYLLNFQGGERSLSGFILSRPLHDHDDLFDQKGDLIISETDEEIEILTNTFYQIDLALNSSTSSNDLFDDGFPIPDTRIIVSVEGKKVHVRPIDGDGQYRGSFKSIGGYNDHPDDGLIISVGEPGSNVTIFQKDMYFRARQSPGFHISPDPFSLENSFPDSFNLTMYEGWELVTYRDIERSPVISLNDSRIKVKRSQGDEIPEDATSSYSAYIPSESGLNGEVLDIEGEAEFQMEVTISFLFFYFPVSPVGVGVPIWFTLISFAIIASLIFVSARSLSQRKSPGDKLRWANPFREDSDILILSRTFAAALFFSWTAVMLLNVLEQPTPVPSVLSDETPIWIRMILLSDASVWEELLTRVLFIGMPLLFLHPSKKWNLDRFKVLLGGQEKFGRSEVILILIASSFFGLAHIGWGPWKVLPTFVSGALFGYLYIRVGLHAAIAMHFLFDYTSFIFDLLNIPYYHLGVLYYFSLLVGGFFLAYLFVQVKRWFEDRSKKRSDPKWILVVHSSLTILLISFLIYNKTDIDIILVLTMVPLLEAGGFFLHRSGRRKTGKVLVGIGSLFTFALAPIGLMWCFEEES